MKAAARLTLASLALAGAAALVQCVPAAGSALELSRPAVFTGQIWRVMTGQLTHWSWAQWFWDALPLVIMTAVGAARSPARTTAAIVASAVLVPLVVLAGCPWLSTYRGLSGIDAALYVFCGVMLYREARRQPRRRRALALALAGFGAKCVYEACTGGAVFADARAAGVVTVPLAHLAGGCVGWVAAGRSR